MKLRNYLPYLIALAALAGLIALFPPFQVTWRHFFQDSAPLSKKLGFLMRVYALPCAMSFIAILMFQLQGRVSMMGFAQSSVFLIALLGSGCMMAAFRTMVSGVGGVPGYALGMALGYTFVSRIHSIQPTGQMLFGKPTVRIVWRGEIEAQMRAAAHLQASPEPGGSEQRNASSNTSNSAKNSSLSLARAEAGM